MKGYTVKQSHQLLEEIHRRQPGPYFYVGCSPIEDENGKYVPFDPSRLDTLLSNLRTLLRIFRQETQPKGRWSVWVMAGDPGDKKSPMLVIDTGWGDKTLLPMKKKWRLGRPLDLRVRKFEE